MYSITDYKDHLLDIVAAVIGKTTSEVNWIRNNLKDMNENDFKCLLVLLKDIIDVDRD